ncbi:MAG: PHP domain-containing protein [bacterium]|nr:PHP domain-containing protein [bacterium]
MIDLHLHSTASDGFLTPRELANYLQHRGVSAFALTDHDTMHGNSEVFDEALKLGLTCIPGIELSCLFEKYSIHLLGYFQEPLPGLLQERLIDIQRWRAERNPRIIEKLQSLGFPVTMLMAEREASDGGQIGRPHIARALLKLNIVKSQEEAFNKYLGSGKPAYVEKDRLQLIEAVQLIHAAGGAAILAHPMIYPFVSKLTLSRFLNKAIETGIDGIEAHYPEHSIPVRLRIERECVKRNLLFTGGSDFHGPVTGPLQPGIGMGDLKVPEMVLQPLLERITERHAARAAA